MADENVGKLCKLTFNNFIVGLRGAVRQSVVHIIHKLTRDASQLRKKKTITELQKEKNARRADKYIEEITFLKSLHPDDLGKFAVLCTKSFKTVGDDPKSSIEERALCRVSEHKSIQPNIIKFRNDYPNWSTEVSNIIKGLGVNFRKKRLERWAAKGKLNEMVEKERKFFLLLHELFGMELDPKMLQKGPVKLKKKQKEENNNTKAAKPLSDKKSKKKIKTNNAKINEKDLGDSEEEEKMENKEEDLNNVSSSKPIRPSQKKFNQKSLDINVRVVDGSEEEEMEGCDEEESDEDESIKNEEGQLNYSEDDANLSEDDTNQSEDDANQSEDEMNQSEAKSSEDEANISEEEENQIEDNSNQIVEKDLNELEKNEELKRSTAEQKVKKKEIKTVQKKLKKNTKEKLLLKKKNIENILEIKSKKCIKPVADTIGLSEIESIFSPFDEQNEQVSKHSNINLLGAHKIKLDIHKSSKPNIKSFVKGTCKVKQLDLTNISEDLLGTTKINVDPMNEEKSSDDEDGLKTNLKGNKSSFFLGRKEIDEDFEDEDQEMDDNKNIDKDNRKRKFKMIRNAGDDESTKFFKKSLYRGETDSKTKKSDNGIQKTYTDGLNRFERRRQQFGPVERQGRKRTFGRGRHLAYNDDYAAENLEGGGDLEHQQTLGQRGRGRGRSRGTGNFNNTGFISRSNALPLGNKIPSTEKKIVKESLLHPSWAAKKKQAEESSSINSFQGKRITFDD